jgi:hypothetical protein
LFEAHLDLGAVAVLSHRVGPHPVGYLPKEKLLRQRPPGARDSGQAIGDDSPGLDQPVSEKWTHRQQDGSGIAAGAGHGRCSLDIEELGKPIAPISKLVGERMRTRVGLAITGHRIEAIVRAQIDDLDPPLAELVSERGRGSVGQGEKGELDV